MGAVVARSDDDLSVGADPGGPAGSERTHVVERDHAGFGGPAEGLAPVPAWTAAVAPADDHRSVRTHAGGAAGIVGRESAERLHSLHRRPPEGVLLPREVPGVRRADDDRPVGADAAGPAVPAERRVRTELAEEFVVEVLGPLERLGARAV